MLPRKVMRCSCGHIACVCNLMARHAKNCRFRVSATCAVPIECAHGHDCCPVCDPCTCGAGVSEEDFAARPGAFVDGT